MFTTLEAADRLEVSRNTLLRWIRVGLIDDVGRDWRGWRIWSSDDIEKTRAFKIAYHRRSRESAEPPRPKAGEIKKGVADSMLTYGRAGRFA